MNSRSTTAVRSRIDRRPPKRSRRRSTGGLPISLKVVLPLLLAAGGGYKAWDAWAATRATIVVVAAEAEAPPKGEIEFFAYDDSGAARSPGESIGRLAFDGGRATVGPDLVPGTALARVSVDGFGVSYALMRAGDQVRCELGFPQRLAGEVLDSGGAPVAEAAVLGLGGGPHGVLLAEAVTDARGGFTLGGFSASVDTIYVRVLAPGHAVAGVEWWLRGDQARTIELQRTSPVTGRLESFVDGQPIDGVRLQAHQLPGVAVQSNAAGQFTIDHLPREQRVRLIATSLPPSITHPETVVVAGARAVQLPLFRAARLRGRVIDAGTGQAIPRARVVHDHGPRGGETAICDALGEFEIGALPPGRIALRALIPVPSRDAAGRSRTRWQETPHVIEVIDGQPPADIEIRIYR